jgi:hypothetical protein
MDPVAGPTGELFFYIAIRMHSMHRDPVAPP